MWENVHFFVVRAKSHIVYSIEMDAFSPQSHTKQSPAVGHFNWEYQQKPEWIFQSPKSTHLWASKLQVFSNCLYFENCKVTEKIKFCYP